MLIRLRSSGQLITDSEFRNQYPNTSFPIQLTEDILSEYDADVVLDGPQPTPTLYQYVQSAGVEEIDGQWYTKFIVVDMTQEQIDALNIQLKQNNKNTAIRLLSDTDWSEVPSVANTSITPHLINVEDFVVYRNALRYIAVNPPITVDANSWPTLPTEQWSS